MRAGTGPEMASLKMARFRVNLGLSQKDAAKGAGLTLRQWQNFESGFEIPEAVAFAGICRTLYSSPADFEASN